MRRLLNGENILQYKQVYIQYKMCYMHNASICKTTKMSNLPSKAMFICISKDIMVFIWPFFFFFGVSLFGFIV
jgi:hypothetical protein